MGISDVPCKFGADAIVPQAAKSPGCVNRGSKGLKGRGSRPLGALLVGRRRGWGRRRGCRSWCFNSRSGFSCRGRSSGWSFGHWGSARRCGRSFSHRRGGLNGWCRAVHVNRSGRARVGREDQIANGEQSQGDDDADKPTRTIAFAGVDSAVTVVGIDSITFWGSHHLLLASEILGEERPQFAVSSPFRDHKPKTIVALKRPRKIRWLLWPIRDRALWTCYLSSKSCRSAREIAPIV